LACSSLPPPRIAPAKPALEQREAYRPIGDAQFISRRELRAAILGPEMLTEHTINDALAAVPRETRHAWRTSDVISSENTGMLRGTAKRPDILVR
jgi:hypothetical protein